MTEESWSWWVVQTTLQGPSITTNTLDKKSCCDPISFSCSFIHTEGSLTVSKIRAVWIIYSERPGGFDRLRWNDYFQRHAVHLVAYRHECIIGFHIMAAEASYPLFSSRTIFRIKSNSLHLTSSIMLPFSVPNKNSFSGLNKRILMKSPGTGLVYAIHGDSDTK